MTQFENFEPKGIIPATLLPFHDDLSIDIASTRQHLRDVTAVKGLSAITVNGHASEVHACTLDEQRQILELSVDEIGDKLPVINGVIADGSKQAASIARMSEQAGASCLLVFPSHTIGAGGGMARPEMAMAHIKTIADATDLPLILFQYSYASNYAYPLDLLLRMADEIPNFRAIKDRCGDPMKHEQHIRTLQNLPRPINVLTTHSAWLMASLSMGCKGVLSGSGSIIADLQVALFEAIQRNDLEAARLINDDIYPTAQCFYAAPTVDMHNRMKEALVILGRLPNATVRPPLVKLTDAEIEYIRETLLNAHIGKDGSCRKAA